MSRRPLAAASLVYMAFLLFTLVLVPCAGDRIFGWSRQEETVQKALSQEYARLTVRVRKITRSRTGYRVLCAYTARKRAVIVQGTCLLVFADRPACEAGDSLQVTGRLSFPQAAGNPGQWDERAYARLQGYDFSLRVSSYETLPASGLVSPFLLIRRGLDRIRNGLSSLTDRLFVSPYSGLVKAMVLGESAMVDEEVRDAFQQAGTAHMIAISGLHLSILSGLLLKILSRRFCPKTAFFIGNLVTWLYVILVGASVSAVRAALMMTFSGLAPILHRKSDHVTSVLFSMLVLLLLKPLYFLSAGFWLSYMALFGLMLGKIFLSALRHLPGVLRFQLSTSLGVTIFTAPVSKLFFSQVSLLSFLLNLLIVPLCQYVMVLSLLSLLLGLIHPALSGAFVFLTSSLLSLMIRLSQAVSSLQGLIWKGSLPPYALMFYYLSLFLLLLSRKNKPGSIRRLFGLVSCGACLFLALSGRSGFRATYLSVGQGDCCVIEWFDKTIVVDAGPSYKTVIEPYLACRGITRIDVLVLSHPDSDHLDGALTLAESGFPVAALLVADVSSTSTEKEQRLEEAVCGGGGQVIRLKEGGTFTLCGRGGRELTLYALSPGEDYGQTNENCLVVFLRLDETTSLLFPGDIDKTVEEKIASSSLPAPVREGLASEQEVILKEAHHGSRTSGSAAFLAFSHADLAVISCGKDNEYGHPHQETLETLSHLQIPYVVTKDRGAVWIEKFGNAAHVTYKTYLSGE